jgi:MFS family permease
MSDPAGFYYDDQAIDYDDHHALEEQYGLHRLRTDRSCTSHDTPVPAFATGEGGGAAGNTSQRQPSLIPHLVASRIQSLFRPAQSDRSGRIVAPQGGQHPGTSCGSKFRHWLVGSAWPGLGLFGESYLLFSIGTLKPIWEELFPQCFSADGNNNENDAACPNRLVHSLTYSVVLGVILGMVLLGYLANRIGRRQGSLLTASLMSGGAIAMAMVSLLIFWTDEGPEAGRFVTWWFRFLSVALFVFGVGVGGEYPLSASSASEKAAGQQKTLRLQQQLRGEPNSPGGGAGFHVMDSSGAVDCKRTSLLTADDQPFPAIEPTIPQTDGTQREWGRGRQVQLVFAMQGMGIWFHSLTLLLLLTLTGQTGGKYDADALILIWRITYWMGAAILCFVLVTRYLYLQESKVWADDKEQREKTKQTDGDGLTRRAFGTDEQATGYIQYPPLQGHSGKSNTKELHESLGQGTSPTLNKDSTVSELSNATMVTQPSDQYGENRLRTAPLSDPNEDLRVTGTQLLWRNFGGRLLGASMSWLLWDISFYGNKLFQSTFLLALTGEETTLLEFAMASTVNATAALLGYYGAAALVDRPEVGRLKLQSVGFLVTGSLFVMCGFCYERLPSGWLVALYLASSFTGQLGPNATTFLIPAEIFPTEQRTLCHGICAAAGKVGALIAAILFHFVERDTDLFLYCGYASFVACLITAWTIPETTGLDLLEIDTKWRMTVEGRKSEYRGPANDSNYLSVYERISKRRANGSTPCDATN